MRKNTLSVLFALTFVVTLAALIQDLRFDHSLAGERAAALALDREIGSLELAASDLRAAQTAYLATGQGPDFWMRRVTEISGQIDSTVARLGTTTRSDAAKVHFGAASSALADVMNIDRRARDNIEREQQFLASDLVFMEGLEASQRLTGELTGARHAATRESEARITRITRFRFAMNALAIGFVVLVALYASRAQQPASISSAASTAEMLRNLPPAVKPPVVVAPQVKAPQPPQAVLNLPDAADLCVDLARVIDDRDVPGLLERAARVLDATRVIIWVADTSGSVLRPTLTHGMSARLLMKMGTLEVADSNVTSQSFRSMRPQTANGAAPGDPGAIAVPLVTAAGCTGVLAAETRDGKPTLEAVAIAKILAAQFATLIPPDELTSSRAVEA